MHRPSASLQTSLVLAREPSGGDGPRWIVAQAEAELVQRYGFLDETERALHIAAFDPPAGAFVVARTGAAGPPVGGVGVRAVDRGFRADPGSIRDEDRAWGEIRRLWVDPDRRAQGVARQLMAAIEEAARDLGVTALRLATGARQPEAVALYESSGWNPEPSNSAAHGFLFTKELVVDP